LTKLKIKNIILIVPNNSERRGNFCLGQLLAGNLEPVAVKRTGYDIPVSEALARADLASSPQKPDLKSVSLQKARRERAREGKSNSGS
jgi:hypothetical protein